MKMLGLSCSPRKQGNTVIMLNEPMNGYNYVLTFFIRCLIKT
jgi:multimeric flavodoxin WrbA